MRTLFATISLTLALPVLAGCGQLGPLYMPEEEPLPATAPTAVATPTDSAPQSASAS